MNIVILCGGSGTRLWPLSVKSSPKQFVPLFDGQSLFEKTIERNKQFSHKFSILVNEQQVALAKKQRMDEVDFEYFVEPKGRNTAPAIALAAMAAQADEVLLILPSDHLIQNDDKYIESIEKAKQFAQEGHIVTFGIRPRYPETGYGYIETDGYELLSFKEKPSYDLATEYLEKGNYYWNSGMFCFRSDVFLQELKEYAPEIYHKAKICFDNSTLNNGERHFNLEDMMAIPALSIDYAIMEHTKKGKHVPANIQWSDLGSFDSLYDELPKDENGNTANKESLLIDSKNNLIYGQNSFIAAIDVEDLIIVEGRGKILITKKGNGQRVKEVVEELNSREATARN